MLNILGGAFETTRSSLQLMQQCGFIGCEKGSKRFQAAPPSLVKVFMKYILSPKSKIVGSEDAIKASIVIMMKKAALALQGMVVI